jgi:hypothetical protein
LPVAWVSVVARLQRCRSFGAFGQVVFETGNFSGETLPFPTGAAMTVLLLILEVEKICLSKCMMLLMSSANLPNLETTIKTEIKA